jgi:Restriction alleviation protein Lar
MTSRYPYEQLAPRVDEDRRLLDAKACPFCGSINLSLSQMGNYVHCHSCGADGPEIQRRRDVETWPEAIERWNVRRDA